MLYGIESDQRRDQQKFTGLPTGILAGVSSTDSSGNWDRKEHKVKLKTPKKTRPHRDFADDIDIIVHRNGPRVRVVQLWRRLERRQNEWTYIGRVPPEVCEIELIGLRFGGGEYRAKLLGDWDSERRQEEYLEQVTFRLDEQYWPMTAETRERIRKQHGM